MITINNYNIDEYIEKSKSMKNTSDGGSAAYHFDDVVLVKYVTSAIYGKDAREHEELIAQEANKKRLKGVRTPAHLAIKRVTEGDNWICWVLQERAKGKSYSNYCSNDSKTQLVLQEKILNAPDSHYEQCIKDLCELFHMGLELKGKNIYYDEDRENGGFTFIDLVSPDPTPLNPDSISDVLSLNIYANFIYGMPYISKYNDAATQEEKDLSRKMKYKMSQKYL